MIAESVFLLPNGTWFVELAVLIVILWIARRYILPHLNRMVEARQEKIRSALEAAESARAEAAAADDERQRVLTEAREQARHIVESAQAVAEQVRSEAAGRGEAEFDRIVASAQDEIATARQRAIDEASGRVGEIVFDLVTKIVGREVDQSAHQDLVNEAVAALSAEARRGA
jgi:F-type H+-transporting ATPase subunit b